MLSALILAAVLSGVATPPLEEVKSTVESIKQIVSNKALSKEKKNSLIHKLIVGRVDFDEMGKRALGRHWKDRTGAERKEYLDVFAKFIEVFYRNRVFNSVEFINSVAISYKEKRDGEFTEVEVMVTAPNGEKYSFVLKLHLAQGHWMAYDFVIEDVSVVQNYRSQFDRIIEREGFASLLKRLREKIMELDK